MTRALLDCAAHSSSACRAATRGLLQNSTNICKQPYKATVKYSAHNGALEAHPLLKAKCPKGRGGKGHGKGHRRHHQ